jgi:hypothetical protein
MVLKGIFWTLAYIVIGGVAFWAPDIALKAYRGYEFSGSDALLLSIIMPCALLTCYGLLFWRRSGRRPALPVALSMLLGVWILGSFSMMLGASFSGGGYAQPGSEVWDVIALGLRPQYTYIMATYDGSLLALSLVTILMVLLQIGFEWVAYRILRRA